MHVHVRVWGGTAKGRLCVSVCRWVGGNLRGKNFEFRLRHPGLQSLITNSGVTLTSNLGSVSLNPGGG